MSTLLKSKPRAEQPKLVSRKLKAVVRTASLNRSASVAQAKANLSSLINSVEKDRAEIILMRRGVPVAKIVPLTEAKLLSGYGWMRGSVHELGDIVGPTGEEWTLSDE